MFIKVVSTLEIVIYIYDCEAGFLNHTDYDENTISPMFMQKTEGLRFTDRK